MSWSISWNKPYRILSSPHGSLWGGSLWCLCSFASYILDYYAELLLSLLSSREINLLQSFLIEYILQILIIFMASPWTHRPVYVFPELWGPEVETVVQMQSDKHWGERDEHISISAHNVPLDAAQDLTNLCCCSGMLLTNIQLAVHQDACVPLRNTAFQPYSSCFVLGSLPSFSQHQYSSLVFAKLHTILLACPSNLSRSICKIIHHSDMSTPPVTLVSPVNSLKVLLFLSSRSCMNLPLIS